MNDPQRLVEIFFYGLHMDADALHALGLSPQTVRLATLHDHCIVLGSKAMLLRKPGADAHGVLMRLPHAAIDQLYTSQPDYRAEAFLADDGAHVVAAISMVHIAPPLGSAPDPVYATKLRALRLRLGLPAD